MAITDGYCTLAELKAEIDKGGTIIFSANDDQNLEYAIEAASRYIDGVTGTWFHSDTQTRYYTAQWSDLLHVDDLISVTSLKTDDDDDGTYETTWTTSDYILEPVNARQNSNLLRPYRQIRIDPNGDYSFPVRFVNGVELIGAFGYAATPPATIRKACIMLAHRLWKRKDTVFGIAGTPAVGGVQIIQAQIKQDADIMALIDQGFDRAYV